MLAPLVKLLLCKVLVQANECMHETMSMSKQHKCSAKSLTKMLFSNLPVCACFCNVEGLCLILAMIVCDRAPDQISTLVSASFMAP